MIDTQLWVGIFLLTAILYSIKWAMGRRKVKVYRISPKSLERSKQVMLRVLPLMEDGREDTQDETRLPYPKENIKSAAKILAYYFMREQREGELLRIRACFIGLSRYQNRDLDHETRDKRAARDRERLTMEFEHYIVHSPFRSGKAA